MKLVHVISIIFYSTLIQLTGYGQEIIKKENQRKLDSIRTLLSVICDSTKPSKAATKSQTQYDTKMLSLCNNLYWGDYSKQTINKLIHKAVKKKAFSIDSLNLGGTDLYQVRLYAKGNLNITFSFATFSEQVVYKIFEIKTTSKTNCGEPIKYYISPNDVDYIEQVCIPNTTFPLHICWNCVSITADTTYYGKLKSYSGSDYVVFPNDTDRLLNYFTWHDITTYTNENVVEEIVPIVKRKDLPLLQKLLFSPNHILAIYAMEALTFLEISEEQYLPESIHVRMTSISNSKIPIDFQHSDVVVRQTTYSNLKVSKKEILDKYNRL